MLGLANMIAGRGQRVGRALWPEQCLTLPAAITWYSIGVESAGQRTLAGFCVVTKEADMASISIPYGYRNVELAQLVAAENGGVVLEQHPAGFVTVEASPRLHITRAMVHKAYGREVSEAVWRSLVVRRRGVIATLTSAEVELQDDVLETGYLVHLPPDLCLQAEALAQARGQTLRDLVVAALRREVDELSGRGDAES